MYRIAVTTLLVLLLMAERQEAGKAAVQTSQHQADLWCTGTSQEIEGADHDLWPGHQILGVNFANQTVTGFGIVARIDRVDPDSISFSGEGPFDRRAPKFGTVAVAGTLNRPMRPMCCLSWPGVAFTPLDWSTDAGMEIPPRAHPPPPKNSVGSVAPPEKFLGPERPWCAR
jgi:hypothetical protein